MSSSVNPKNTYLWGQLIIYEETNEWVVLSLVPDICYSFNVNLESVEGLPKKLNFFRKKTVPTILDDRLRDLEEQISQGERLFGSGGSLNPEQLSSQLAVLSEQKEGLLARGNQKIPGLEAKQHRVLKCLASSR